MITRVLRQHGIYFGQVLDRNSEAQVFQNINDAILRGVGSSWKKFDSKFLFRERGEKRNALLHIVRSRHLFWQHFFKELGATGAVERLDRVAMIKKPLKNYFGLGWPNKDMRKVVWGWKDPRNTLTLSIWLKLFPDAKIVHVIRNGIDVANSLWLRCKKMGWGLPECDDWAYCFRLWELYVEEARQYKALLGQRYMEVRYERFVSYPQNEVRRMMDFLNLDMPLNEAALVSIDSTRSEIAKILVGVDALTVVMNSNLFEDLGYRDVLLRGRYDSK